MCVRPFDPALGEPRDDAWIEPVRERAVLGGAGWQDGVVDDAARE